MSILNKVLLEWYSTNYVGKASGTRPNGTFRAAQRIKHQSETPIIRNGKQVGVSYSPRRTAAETAYRNMVGRRLETAKKYQDQLEKTSGILHPLKYAKLEKMARVYNHGAERAKEGIIGIKI